MNTIHHGIMTHETGACSEYRDLSELHICHGKEHLNYRLLHGAAPTLELMAKNLPIHQLVNCGAIPPDESPIDRHRDLFDIYERSGGL